MGKINMGIFYGKKYNPRNRTFSLENGENFVEGTGQGFCKELCKILWKRNNTWNIRLLVYKLFVPSAQGTIVLYCRLTDFYFFPFSVSREISTTFQILPLVHDINVLFEKNAQRLEWNFRNDFILLSENWLPPRVAVTCRINLAQIKIMSKQNQWKH